MKNDNTKNVKRKDKKGRVLRTGETQQPDGRYRYSYTVNGKAKVFLFLEARKDGSASYRKKRMRVSPRTGAGDSQIYQCKCQRE